MRAAPGQRGALAGAAAPELRVVPAPQAGQAEEAQAAVPAVVAAAAQACGAGLQDPSEQLQRGGRNAWPRSQAAAPAGWRERGRALTAGSRAPLCQTDARSCSWGWTAPLAVAARPLAIRSWLAPMLTQLSSQRAQAAQHRQHAFAQPAGLLRAVANLALALCCPQ